MLVELTTSVEAALIGPELERAWHEALNAWEDALPAQRADCRASVSTLRDQFLRLWNDVPDPQERNVLIAVFYIQVKAQWIQANTQITYQISENRLDSGLICRAGLLSALVGTLEPFLPVDVQNRITTFLSQPTDPNSPVTDPGSVPGTLAYATMMGTVLDSNSNDSRIQLLSQTVGSLNQEFFRLQTEREQEKQALVQNFGTSDVNEIVAQFRRLEVQARQGSPYANSADIPSASNGSVVSDIFTFSQGEINSAIQAKEKELLSALSVQLSERNQLMSEHQYLLQVTGESSVEAVIALIRRFRDEMARAETQHIVAHHNWEAFRTEFGEQQPQQIVAAMRELSERVTTQEKELALLQVTKAALEREFGTIDSSVILAEVHTLRNQVADLKTEVYRIAPDREILERELGKSDAASLIALIRMLQDRVADLSRQLSQYETDRTLFAKELGQTDALAIISGWQEMKRQVQSYTDIAAILGNMEDALKTLNA